MGVSIPFIAGQWSLPPRATHLPPLTRGLNPLHCGAVVASRGCVRRRRRLRDWSQSPSLRGSGRFAQSRKRRRGKPPSLNPLHCGAVVASRWRCGRICAGAASLNPLHCGAVVASGWRLVVCDDQKFVSIPFIAGQWSLRKRGRGRKRRRFVSIPFIAGQWSLQQPHGGGGQGGRMSQSPSLRGSGRFRRAPSRASRSSTASLNPLHCGAVVASFGGLVKC